VHARAALTRAERSEVLFDGGNGYAHAPMLGSSRTGVQAPDGF